MRLALLGARSELLSSPNSGNAASAMSVSPTALRTPCPADVIRTSETLVKEGYITPETAIRFDSIDEEFKKLRLSKVREVIEAEFDYRPSAVGQ